MSESIGKPWIEPAVINALVEHAHELPSPAQIKGRAQIVQFLTFRQETGDGGQPKDRDTVLWAEITDSQWVIPARIANEATNMIEDERGRALTYYRRGFFTLKAAILYDFVPQQVSLPGGGSKIKRSSLKQLLLDITELRYISGGGPGVPVAVRSVALQTCPELGEWEKALCVGGQTLINKQRQTKIALESARASKASSRQSNSTNASKRASKAPIKTPMQQVTPQPSVDKLAGLHEWQDSFWGKRTKYMGLNNAFGPKELDMTPDQQAKLTYIIEERIKTATPSQPYDPTNPNKLHVPDRDPDLPSFRASQVVSSTPVDVRLPPSSPIVSQASEQGDDSEQEPEQEPEHDAPSDHDDNELGDNSGYAVPSRQALGQEAHSPDGEELPGLPAATSKVDQAPRTGGNSAGPASERSVGADQAEALDADDAISEKILNGATQNGTDADSEPPASPRQPHQPTVLVPDSDPLSQRHTQVRHSSPWECESVAPSQPGDHSRSPEAYKRSPVKGKRHFSPTLSSPPAKNIQSTEPPSDSQKPPSKQGGSQESAAAASLPSPPPEAPNEPNAAPQHTDYVPNSLKPIVTGEPTNQTQTLRYQQDKEPRHDIRNQQEKESFDTRPRTEQVVSKKRRLSQSQSEEPSATVPQQKIESHAGRTQVLENKRRRLSAVPAKNTPYKPNSGLRVTSRGREVRPGASVPLSNTGVNDSNQSASRDVIPHDHEAWSAPSWMNSRGAGQSEAQVSSVLSKAVTSSSSTAAHTQDKPESMRVLKPKPRISRPTLPKAVQRAASPNYPPVTASQVADADEDADERPLPNFKVEPVTPARKTLGQTSIMTKASKVIQPPPVSDQPAPGGRDSTPALHHPNPPRGRARLSAPVVANRTGTAQDRTNARLSEVHRAPKQNERDQSTSTRPKPSTSRATDGGRSGDTTGVVEPGSSVAARKQYLRGFQPSLSLDLKQEHAFRWSTWLKVAREANEFWQDEELP